MNKLLCFSEKDFIELMNCFQWNNNNIPESVAIISIIGSKESISTHYFNNSTQVLNLEFDDVGNEEDVTNKSMSEDQAVMSVEFIKRNIGKDFYIHCKAGKSRSQAFVRFILDFYPEYYSVNFTNFNNPCITPNIDVLSKLKKVIMFY